MKTLEILPKSSLKVSRGENELGEKDVEEIPKGLAPGEWVLFFDKTAGKKYIGHINPYSESYFKIKIVQSIPIDWKDLRTEDLVAVEIIKNAIRAAAKKRAIFTNYQAGYRLIYGSSDHLTGLIVDIYKKYIFIQINVAGIDRFRKDVEAVIAELFPNHSVKFFDNPQYRKQEVLPVFENPVFTEDLAVL